MCWILYEKGKEKTKWSETFTLLTSNPAYFSNFSLTKIFILCFVLLQNENKLQTSEISCKIKMLVGTLR